jgi:hypothetical protein
MASSTRSHAFHRSWPPKEINSIGPSGRRANHCELKVSISDFVYLMHDGHLGTLTQTQLQTLSERNRQLLRNLKPDDVDPRHYPLRFALLQSEWAASSPGFVGSGRGNLFYPDGSIKGLDYSALCPNRLQESMGSESFPARYDDASGKLTVLSRKAGESSFSASCELKIDTKPWVFVRNTSNGLSTITPEEARKRRVALNLSPDQ